MKIVIHDFPTYQAMFQTEDVPKDFTFFNQLDKVIIMVFYDLNNISVEVRKSLHINMLKLPKDGNFVQSCQMHTELFESCLHNNWDQASFQTT